MNLYEKYILPPLLNCACGLSLLKRYRKDIVPRARGAVLEVGIGSSLNKDFYDFDQITEISGLDPNESLLKIVAMLIGLQWLRTQFRLGRPVHPSNCSP